jgi:hypothetical protein
MIYCVDFDEVERHLSRLGFRRAGRTERNSLFRRADDIVIIHAPNVDGHVPEILVNDAFDAAGLPCPAWHVFWCD